MTAIFGAIGGISESELGAMADRLRHRGSIANWWFPASDVALGVCSSATSIQASSSRQALVVHGPILPRRDDETPEVPVPDARVVASLEQHGLEALGQLGGVFALAYWDSRSKQLILARDWVGMRSLFFARDGDRWLFASEIKALLAIPSLPARPNFDALQRVNLTHSTDRFQSCLLDVEPVPPSHYVALAPGKRKLLQIWNPPVERAPRSDAEHVEGFRRRFLDATRAKSESYPRIGIALSAGLDSAVCLAALRGFVPEAEIRTYSVGFSEDDPELTGAAVVAEAFDSIHKAVILEPTDLTGLLPELCWTLEVPTGREEPACMYAAARAASGEVDALLTGYLADVVLGGMPRHRLVHMIQKLPFGAAPFVDLYRYTRACMPARSLLGSLLLRLYYKQTCPPPHIIGAGNWRTTGNGGGLMPELSTVTGRGEHSLTRFLYAAILAYPGKGPLDSVHGAFGIDVDSPFVDTDLVEYSMTIPDHLKIRGRTQKAIVRDALENLLPPEILQKRKSIAKVSNDVNIADAFENQARNLLSPTLVRERGVFDPAFVEQVVRREPGKLYPKEQLYRLWGIIMTELWLRIFIDHRGARPGP